MIYTLLRRGRSIKRKNNFDFVTWMRNHDMQLWDNNLDFMHAYSHRKSTFEKIYLRFENENDFVEDLQKANLLRIEPSLSIWQKFQSKVLAAN